VDCGQALSVVRTQVSCGLNVERSGMVQVFQIKLRDNYWAARFSTTIRGRCMSVDPAVMLQCIAI
jgi:hypothetical protein